MSSPPAPEPLAMPTVGFGTYLLETNVDTTVATAIKAGYRHIDTAQGYNNEEGVGQGIKLSNIPRSSIFITTKLWPGNPAWGMPVSTYDEVISSCELSLSKLQTPYVDLFLIHTPFAYSPDNDALLQQYRACVTLKERGLVREIGVSNFNITHLQAIESLEPPFCNQLELHPLCQQRELLAFMKTKSVIPVAYSSLAPLSSWRNDDDPEDSGKDRGRDAVAKASEVLEAIAGRHGKSTAQVLLRWGVQKGYKILPKSIKLARMQQNLDIDFVMEAKDMADLDGLRGESDLPLAWGFGDPTK